MMKFNHVFVVTGLLALSSVAQGVSINFDTNAGGAPLPNGGAFGGELPLTNLYSSLGVNFSGPTAGNGGAILDQSGNFGVNARSGTKFLAFNRGSSMSNGGIPTDPETLTFSALQQSVSIYASGGDSNATFVMNAYNAVGGLVATNTVLAPSGGYGLLGVSFAGGIKSVVLTSATDPTFVFDDLSYSTVPEPASMLASSAVLSLCARRRRV
jgi:hypothetical protein